jgi:hypothetical protein
MLTYSVVFCATSAGRSRRQLQEQQHSSKHRQQHPLQPHWQVLAQVLLLLLLLLLLHTQRWLPSRSRSQHLRQHSRAQHTPTTLGGSRPLLLQLWLQRRQQ